MNFKRINIEDVGELIDVLKKMPKDTMVIAEKGFPLVLEVHGPMRSPGEIKFTYD